MYKEVTREMKLIFPLIVNPSCFILIRTTGEGGVFRLHGASSKIVVVTSLVSSAVFIRLMADAEGDARADSSVDDDPPRLHPVWYESKGGDDPVS